MPEAPLGLYDNYSKDSKSNRAKSPVFEMIGSDGVSFEIPWNSKSASNMVCTPYKNYEEFNAWLKKVFFLLESEFKRKYKKR